MTFRELHSGKREVILWREEETYGIRTTEEDPVRNVINPFGGNTTFDPTATEKIFEMSQPAGKDSLDQQGAVKTQEIYGGTLAWDLVYGQPLKLIGSGVYDRQIGGAGSYYNHVVDLHTKFTMLPFSMDAASRHTTPIAFNATSMYGKSLNIASTTPGIVRCSMDCGAHYITDSETYQDVAEVTTDPFIHAQTAFTVEGSSVAYITGMNINVIANLNEDWETSSSVPYRQPEPSKTGYEVTGVLNVKVLDKTFWDYFETGSLPIANLSEINNNKIELVRSSNDKITLTFGDLLVNSGQIPSNRDDIRMCSFNFRAIEQEAKTSSAATSTSANNLKDTGETFTAGTEGAVVHNTTDNTKAVVTEFVDADTLRLSADIMVDEDEYDIYRGSISIVSKDTLTTH